MNKPNGQDNHIFFGTFYSLISIILIKGINFLRTIIIARLLGPYDFGLFSLLMSFYYLVLSISIFGYPLTAVKFISREFTNKSKLAITMTSLSFLSIMTGLLVCWVSFSSSDFVALTIYRDQIYEGPLKILSLAILLQSLFLLGTSFLQGLSQFKVKSLLEIFDAISGIIVMMMLTYFLKFDGAAYALLTNSFLSFLLLVFLLIGIFKRNGIKFSLSLPRNLKSIIWFSLPLFLFSSTTMAFYWFGDAYLKIMGAHVEQLGWVYIARSLGQVITFLPAAISVPLLPIISSDEHQSSSFYDRILRITFACGLSTFLIVSFIGKAFIPSLYGTEYSGAIESVYLFSFASLFIAFTNFIYANILIALGRIWHVFYLNMIWGILFIISVLILVSFYAVFGLLLSYIISYGLYMIIVTITLVRNNLLSRFPWFLLIVTCFSGIAGYLICMYLEGIFFIITAIIILIFILGISWFFILDEASKESIKSLGGFIFIKKSSNKGNINDGIKAISISEQIKNVILLGFVIICQALVL